MDITNMNFEEKTFLELDELEILLKSNIIPKSHSKKKLKELYNYQKTFCCEVYDSLWNSNCVSGKIPYRGRITIENLNELFTIMPDLYDYLKISYSAIESIGDNVINEILDECKNGDAKEIEKIINNEYACRLFEYIEDTYYYGYLPGCCPTPFSIFETSNCNCRKTLPRDLFWWKTTKTL